MGTLRWKFPTKSERETLKHRGVSVGRDVRMKQIVKNNLNKSMNESPMTNEKTVAIIPTIGRRVYYKARGSADGVFPKIDRAATIMGTRPSSEGAGGPEGTPVKWQVRLFVMTPYGTQFTEWLDQGQEGGQWDWMPFQKDQQARLASGTANASHGVQTPA